MAATIPTCEPIVLTAGDSHEFTRVVADYPPSEGWTLSYTVLLASERVCPTVTDDDVNEYTVTFAAADFAKITAEAEALLVGVVTGSGDYAGERHEVYRAALTLLPNPEETTLDAMRSDAEIELAAVKSAITSITAGGNTAYSISGRTATKLDLPKLYQRQAVLEARIRDEKGLGFKRRVVAFV